MSPALNELLRATSRSFWLTLRVLPGAIRPQIGLAYLLARTTDTIADTEILPVEQRLDALQKLRERILGQSAAPLNFGGFAENQNSPAEKLLLERVEESLAALPEFSDADQKLIRDVLKIITSGQALDLQKFAPARGDARLAQKIIALETDAELSDYTYRVAGCVGEFWMRICRAHLFPNAKLNDSFRIEFGERDAGIEKFFRQLDDSFLIQLGISFGKGLQLVNILRDLPADLKNGRCYLPLEKLEPLKLLPETLLSPANEEKFLPLFHEFLDRAEAHLRDGWLYTNALPFSQFRVRLACAWPILIGIRTIEKLRAADSTELQSRVKISRREVRGIIFRSLLASPFPGAWKNLFPANAKAVASGKKLA